MGVTKEIVSDLLVPQSEAKARLQARLELLARVRSGSLDHVAWYDETIVTLDALFASKANNYFSVQSGFEFSYIRSRGRVFKGANLDRAEGIIKRMINWLDDIGAPTVSASKVIESSKVFIVHGHDEAAREKVERLIEKIGLEPVVLNKQANGGKTILEKIEAHGEVGFAVVLFTADDLGGSIRNSSPTEHRPRQNVLLELGYFWGKIGRDRVCLLNAIGSSISSDLAGLGYTSLDERGAWRLELVKELKYAGYTVDANALLQL